MRILYVAPMYDYGEPARGFSFEHYNFYDTLVCLKHDIIYFDSLSEIKQRGKEASSARLIDIVKSERPDLLFCVLFKGEIDVDAIHHISTHTDTVTFNWFCDDHWRFENFSRHWAPAFNWVSTTAASAIPKYREIGYASVIKTQWACNHFSYRPVDGLPMYDVTFVGQPHGNRRQVIDALRKAGVDVKAWGHGWETGRLSQEQMIEVFGVSRINLNLSNASVPSMGWKRWLHRHRGQYSQQIKGRNFEIPGCGGFTITGTAENLDRYYVPDREISVFGDVQELVHKVDYYLHNDRDRQAIAQAGYARTLAEHTYEKRFNDIFATLGLPA